MENKIVYSKYRYAKISPKKVMPVSDLVRGKPLSEAIRILKFDTTKAAKMSLKALTSALANAKSAHNLKEEDLYVSEIQANDGPMYKRPQFTGHGHYSRKLKRTSHIVVGLGGKEGK